MTLGPIAFLAPGLLGALLLLPVLWWLLRAVPPAPGRVTFPGVRLLLGLRDAEKMPERTPWWLLLLRLLALAAAILAFAGPVLNPRPERGAGPLLLLLDGGWADAPAWSRRLERLSGALEEAGRDGRPVAVLQMTALPPEGAPAWRSAAEWQDRLPGLAPAPFVPDRAAWAAWAGGPADGAGGEGFETLWLSDGLTHPGEAPSGAGDLAAALAARGPVTVALPPATARALGPPRLSEGAVEVEVLRAGAAASGVVSSEGGADVALSAVGPDPNGLERVLGTATARLDAGADSAVARFDLPIELRNRISRLQLSEGLSAGGVALADDALRRRKVGLIAGRAGGEAQDLVDPLLYLRTALEPFAEVVEAPLAEMMTTAPDMIVMADVGAITESERGLLMPWIEAGGVLVRFAGPRLAQSGAGQTEADPLLPVRLRAGGRNLGGAMSWGAPRQLRPFPDDGPFAGLAVPADVDISAQVMAQPDPDLPQRVLASLEDGTPLVTARGLGQGRVVLFHVTANAEWSTLALSGLYVGMLERLAASAGGLGASAEALTGTVWTPLQLLDGFGRLGGPGLVAGVPGDALASDRPSAGMPPGIYASGERRTALNALRAGDRLAPLGPLPAGVAVETLQRPEEIRLGPWLLALALGLLAVDALATLALTGRFRARRGSRPAPVSAAVLALAGALCAGLATALPAPARAQDGPGAAEAEARAMNAANETVLAYVATGSRRVDDISAAGLRGLSRALFERTAIEPADPVAVDLERDDLSLYPFLYWPVTEDQRPPSAAAYGRLNDFLRNGGMILFDTRDADLGSGSGTPNGRALQRIAMRLDIPPLAPMPEDHVLTRTFYLLQDFPGRWTGSTIWVEAAPPAEEVEGMPFRNLNDGVTPVVIGGNDWASAWAVGEGGQPLFPVGRGLAGERQREMALRFGVNLIMHVMTGNYKSDQVHVPALLDRLGQ